jgi:hypothetical protein
MANIMAHLFSYPANLVIIHSNPHPGCHPLFCRVSKAPLFSQLPETQPCSYFKSPPISNRISRPNYQWQYTNACEAGDGNTDVTMEEDSSMFDVGEEFQHNDLDLGSYYLNPGQLQEDEVQDTVENEVQVALDEPMPDVEELQLLKEQHNKLDAEVDQRFFYPRKNPQPCSL